MTDIKGYHAHVYYDPVTRSTAERLRDAIISRFAVARHADVDAVRNFAAALSERLAAERLGRASAIGALPLHAARPRGVRCSAPYRRCGSIEIEAGRSLPTKIGRRMCD
jgi:hypothetical protein